MERLAEAVRLLDERGPKDWRAMVDPGTLDVGSYELCVLGQIYGSYPAGLYALGEIETPDDLAVLDYMTEWPQPFDCLGGDAVKAAWIEDLGQA